MTKLIPLAALAAALLVAPATAQRPMPAGSVTVSRADLDLARGRDVRTFDRRVARAARQLCGAPSQWDLAGANIAARCRAATVASVSARRAALIADARGRATMLAMRD